MTSESFTVAPCDASLILNDWRGARFARRGRGSARRRGLGVESWGWKAGAGGGKRGWGGGGTGGGGLGVGVVWLASLAKLRGSGLAGYGLRFAPNSWPKKSPGFQAGRSPYIIRTDQHHKKRNQPLRYFQVAHPWRRASWFPWWYKLEFTHASVGDLYGGAPGHPRVRRSGQGDLLLSSVVQPAQRGGEKAEAQGAVHHESPGHRRRASRRRPLYRGAESRGCHRYSGRRDSGARRDGSQAYRARRAEGGGIQAGEGLLGTLPPSPRHKLQGFSAPRRGCGRQPRGLGDIFSSAGRTGFLAEGVASARGSGAAGRELRGIPEARHALPGIAGRSTGPRLVPGVLRPRSEIPDGGRRIARAGRNPDCPRGGIGPQV